MAPRPVSKRGKQPLVSLSSSSGSSCDQEEEEDVEEESPDDGSDDDYDDVDADDDDDDDDDGSEQEDLKSDEDYKLSSCIGDDDDGGGADIIDEYGAWEDTADDEELCGRVFDLLQRGKSLNMLRLHVCKAYLRKHELRLSGNKATCIDRILEHWRLKDRDGEKLYPKSSFVIDCTGDVCKGDVILFKQRVYRKFDVVTRGADIIGKRTIAGRVVKESYGAAKQQHTFTVEILWCKGVKALPPLFPLLVKGRNLYRLKTFRQRWKSEAERSKVLAEKHRRGATARHARELAKAKSGKKGSKRGRDSSNKAAPSKKRMKRENEPARIKKKPNQFTENASSKSRAKIEQIRKTRYTGPSAAHMKQPHHLGNGIPTQCSFPHPIRDHYIQRGSHQMGDIAASQAIRGTYQIPSYNAGYFSNPNRVLHHQALNQCSNIRHPYPDSMLHFNPRSSSNIWRQPESNNGGRLPPGMEVHSHRWRWP